MTSEDWPDTPIPCPIPSDPHQKLAITCACCGRAIDFRMQDVFLHANGVSWVCRRHVSA